jgi:predicted ATPase
MPRGKSNDFYFGMRENRNKCRLESVRLKNFKSVIDQEINLAPLTVIVGKNSSGKSTVLQSILFLGQNASNPLRRNLAESGCLDLNGELVSLGVFKEALNDRASSTEALSIGGKFSFNYDQSMELQPSSNSILNSEDVLTGKSGTLHFNMNLEAENNSNEASILSSKSSDLRLDFEGKILQHVSSSKSELADVNDLIDLYNEDLLEETPDLWSGLSVFHEARITSSGSLHGTTERPGFRLNSNFANLSENTDLQGVKHVLGLPVNGLTNVSRYTFFLNRQKAYFDGNRLRSNVIFTMNQYQRKLASNFEETLAKRIQKNEIDEFSSIQVAVKEYVNRSKEFILGTGTWITQREYDLTGRTLIKFENLPFQLQASLIHPVSDSAPSEVRDLTSDANGNVSFKLSQLLLFAPYINFDRGRLAAQVVDMVRSFWKLVETQLEEELLDFVGNGVSDVLVPASLNDEVSQEGEGLSSEEFEFGDAVVRLSEYFENLVYLGPLRLEPSDIYKRTLGSRNSQLPLGMQGEHLARMIFENPSSNYPLPPDSTVQIINGRSTFTDALNAWLKWLGIAKTGIEVTTDRHYGFRLTVDRRYLRSLGVGVSQVIPVIGVCLLAETGSLILLEEPELHLNPNIQQKLADFFLAMTDSGRQLIVETHSEYLITRLRLRAMQDPSNCDKFNFIFTEQEHENWNPISAKSPYTVYREVKPSENGELPEWPAGFFDQVTTDVQALLDEMIKREESM